MSSAFEKASRIASEGPGRFVAQLPDGWQQGKGAFGGLVLGILGRALGAAVPEPGRRLRVLTGDLCGPVTVGRADIEVTVLRHGARITHLDSRLRQDGAVKARASAVFSAPMTASAVIIETQAPAPPPWKGVEVVPVAPPFGPVFAPHYEYRSTGALPLSGGPPCTEGFIREAEPCARLDLAALLGRMDAWWPALFAAETQLRPMATVSFTFELLMDPSGLDPEEPLFHRAKVAALEEGLSLEFRELWSGARRVAMNQQTFAVLG
jgi:hypothetical protein